MLQLKDDNGNLLPQDVQDRVNKFIDNIPNVSWFKPNPDLKKSDVDKQVNFILECFGVKAGIEYKKFSTEKGLDYTWDSFWASARASALDSALDSASVSASASSWVSVRASAWDSAWFSSWDSAMSYASWTYAGHSAGDSADASKEILLEDNEEFKKKYPNGAFKQLFKLWEMGLYPVGVLKDTGKFTVYVPDIDLDTWDEPTLPPQEEVTLSDGKTYLVEERDGEKILKLKQ